MNKLEMLLQADQLKVKTVGNPKNGGIIKKMIIASTVMLGLGASAVLFFSDSDTTNTNNSSFTIKNNELLSVVKGKLLQAANNQNQNEVKEAVKQTKFLINEASPLVNQYNKDQLNEAGNFDLPSNLADNQIARKVAQLQFEKENYSLSLKSEAEGFGRQVYNDNIGKAFGYGWNLTFQNSQYNKDLATAISTDKNYINKIVSLSGKEGVTKSSAGLTIEPQRAMQVSALMSERFYEGAINGIASKLPKNKLAVAEHNATGKSYKEIAVDVYNRLEENEKAVVVYHAYKVGSAGFAKYNNLINSLITYSFEKEKTPEMRRGVADQFTYKYKLNGKVLEDTRASILIGAMFADPSAFGYLIGKNVAPQNMRKLTSSFDKYNIDGKAEPGTQMLPDTLGDEKARIEKEGGKLDIILLPENDPLQNIKEMRKPKKQNSNSIPYGYGIMG